MLQEILKGKLLDIYHVFSGHLNVFVFTNIEAGLIIFLITLCPESLEMRQQHVLMKEEWA